MVGGEWTPEQWILVITTTISSISAAIVSIRNSSQQKKFHRENSGKLTQTQNSLQAADSKLEANTNITLTTLSQSKNLTNELSSTRMQMALQIDKLNDLVRKQEWKNKEIAGKIALASEILLALAKLEIELATPEMQEKFDGLITQLKDSLSEVKFC